MKLNNVYIKETSTVAGKIEQEGPLKKYFDKIVEDYYFNEKTVEQAETKFQEESIDILLNKTKKQPSDIDLLVSGDLQNQIVASSYASLKYEIPYLGVYNACATSVESIIIASNFLENKTIKNAICTTSSHNLASEKQFRNPIEYGAPKPKTATFTATGGASIMLTNEKTDLKISSYTIGKTTDLMQNDPNNMGAVMAPAAADTIYRHLKENNETPEDYDLILTGDLGKYGMEILKDYMKQEYKINLGKNYNDCGVILYNMRKQNEITAGGSGPVCSALVNYSYIYQQLKEKKLNKVLLVATGALFNPTLVFQKKNILSIAHAITVEVAKWHIYYHFYLQDHYV